MFSTISEDVKPHIIVSFVSEPRSDMKREVKLGSYTRSELDCLLLQVPATGFPDSVFVTLFCTAVKRASCRVHKWFRTGVVFSSSSSSFV